MPSPKRPTGKEVLYGDDLSRLLDEVKIELGGDKGVAAAIAKNMKGGDNNNPYLQTRAFQTYLRLVEKIDARGIPGEVLTDEELEDEIRKDCIRYLVVMPADEFDPLMEAVAVKRKALADRIARVEAAREAALRPASESPNNGISKSVA